MDCSIPKAVQQIIADGYLSAAMEDFINQAYDNQFPLTVDDYLALDRLMDAISTKQVLLLDPTDYINIMEELVLDAVLSQLTVLSATEAKSVDIGDVAAYALNRLPPLYARSVTGASFQRTYAQENLQGLIAQQVEQGIAQVVQQPYLHAERQPIKPKDERETTLKQMTALLKAHAERLQPPLDQN